MRVLFELPFEAPRAVQTQETLESADVTEKPPLIH